MPNYMLENRQLQIWLSEDDYAQFNIKKQEQLELQKQLKNN